MKKILVTTALVIAFVFTSTDSSAQVIIRVRPAPPVIVRPVAPSARHIWIDGNWVWRGNNYVWVDGYWAEPRPGFRWVPGHWKHRRGGWFWVPGHWRRR
jgi:hypothetical protein